MRFRLTPGDFSRLMGMATRTCERTQLAVLRAAYARAFGGLSRAVSAARSAGNDSEMRRIVEAATLSYLRTRNLMAAFFLQRRPGSPGNLPPFRQPPPPRPSPIFSPL